jgi:hypothetical protein
MKELGIIRQPKTGGYEFQVFQPSTIPGTIPGLTFQQGLIK